MHRFVSPRPSDRYDPGRHLLPRHLEVRDTPRNRYLNGFKAALVWVLVCTVIIGWPERLPAQTPSPGTISAEIRRQDEAWDDIEVRYDFETDLLTDDGTWVTQPVLRMNWKLTRDGWQRVRRERDAGSGVWVEEASFDGEYYMAGDSQGTGSGSIGHQNERFLYNSNVPRLFGLYVTGQELSQPVSVAEFLLAKDLSVASSVTGNTIIVKGGDPLAEGVTLELELDPAIGYRPRRLSITDDRGKLSDYTDLQFRKLKGTRGDFWFPEFGVWQGYNPEDRTEASRLRYRAREILVDRHPQREEFALVYPAGALLLNTDTGETVYLKADSSVTDIPDFEGKRLSLAEHDRQARREAAAPAARQSRWTMLAVLNLLGFALLLIVLFARTTRKRT